jgi:hypothetical protein
LSAIRPGLLPPSGLLFACLAAAMLWLSRGETRTVRTAFVLVALAAVFLAATPFVQGYSFLMCCGVAKEPVRTALAILLAAAVLFFLPPRHARRVLGFAAASILAGTLACCAWGFLHRVGGFANPVYTDDHPSFMFRVTEFFHSFPHLENYVPHWNAGVVNSVLASSGTPAFALLGSPFFLPFRDAPHLAYNAAFLFAFVLFIPALTYAAFRAGGFSKTISATGCLLSFASSRFLLMWLLHFGTVGSALAMSSVPAAVLFLHAATVRRSRSPWVWGGFLLSFVLLSQWLPMAILSALLALAALSCARDWWSPKRFAALAACGIAAFLVLLPLLRASAGAEDLVAFASQAPATRPSLSAVLARIVPVCAHPLAGIHPLPLALGLAGLPLLAPPLRRRFLAIPLAGLALVALLGPFFRGNMQLERMLFPAVGLLAVGAAPWLEAIADPPAPQAGIRRRLAWAGAWGVVLVLLLAGGHAAACYYRAESFQPFEGMLPSIRELVEEARARVGENERLLVAGRAVHAYGHGHIAYLPVLIGREMLACDYYGFPPHYVEMDYPPKKARKQPGGMHGFMVRHGASHVLTCRPNYEKFFAAEPEHFREAARIPSEWDFDYVLYEIAGATGVVLAPDVQVEIESDFNRLSFRFPGDVPEEVLFAYNWSDRFRVAPKGAEILPEPLPTGETFLKVRPHGERRVAVTYEPRY